MSERNPADAAKLGLHLLVLRCQAGDEAAFARLLTEFGPRTLGYLQGLVGEAAEDLQQEVWLKVYRGIASLAAPGAFRTWLYRITRHQAMDFLRRRKREREILAEWPEDAIAAVADPAAGLDRALPDELLELVGGLEPAQREVLLLRYRDDLSYAEMALVLGCATGTVRSRLHYARRRLHELVAQDPGARPSGGPTP
jgi:RNA polymerase sigma-70 factor (ECF subfamily)